MGVLRRPLVLLIAIILLSSIALATMFVLKTQRDIVELKAQREEQALVIKQLQDEQARTLKMYQSLNATKLQITNKRNALIKRIEAAPADDDAPLSPVLKNALEGVE